MRSIKNLPSLYVCFFLFPCILTAQKNPDLAITSLRVNELRGNTITYSYVVTNVGNVSIPLKILTSDGLESISLRTVISKDRELGFDDVDLGIEALGTVDKNSLEPLESIGRTIEVDLPKDPSSFPFLLMKVDDSDLLKESIEENNVKSAQILCPDLIISSLHLEQEGEKVVMRYDVKNIGTERVLLGSFSLQIRTSTAEEGGNIKIVNTEPGFGGNGSFLAPGDSVSGSYIFGSNFPFADFPYFFVEIDNANQIEECDEENNIDTVKYLCGDLIILDLRVEFINNAPQIKYILKNIGDATLDMEGVRLRLTVAMSEDFDPERDSILHNFDMGNLRNTLDADLEFPVTTILPADFPLKDFPYLRASADLNDQVQECSENNNVTSFFYSCPDLVVSELTASRASDGVSYSFEIKNIGTAIADLTGSAGDVAVQAMLSDDEVFGNEGDLPAGGIVVGPFAPTLEPDETYSRNFQGSFDFKVSEKPYFVLKVDHQNRLNEECDENNNTLAIAIQCPDLVVTSFENKGIYDPGAAEGVFFIYSYTITNQGTYPADLNGALEKDSDNVKVRAFFSKDQIFDNQDDVFAGGEVLGTSSNLSLAAGESITITDSVGLQLDDPSEFPFLVIKIDDEDNLDECKEGNNVLVAPFSVATGLSDQLDPGFSIYPNPIEKFERLHVQTSLSQYKGSIVGSDGKVHSTFTENDRPKLEDLSNGLYWLLIRNEEGLLVGRKAFVLLP